MTDKPIFRAHRPFSADNKTWTADQERGVRLYFSEATWRLKTLDEALRAELPQKPTKQQLAARAQSIVEAWSSVGQLKAYVVGAGKTLVALSIMVNWHAWLGVYDKLYPMCGTLKTALSGPFLIVSEAAGRHVWESELRKWYRNIDPAWIRTATGSGEIKAAVAALKAGACQAISVSYDGVASDWETLATVGHFSIVVYDEAHNIRDQGTKKVRGINMLRATWSNDAPVTCNQIGLTGTPYTNKTEKMYTLLATLSGYPKLRRVKGEVMPVLHSPKWAYDEREVFEARYVGHDGFRAYGINLRHDPTVYEDCRLHDAADCWRLHETMERVTAMDRVDRVQGIPKADRRWVAVPLGPAQRRVYDTLVDEVVLPTINGADKRPDALAIERLALFTYAFQCCAGMQQLEWSVKNKKADAILADAKGLVVPPESSKQDWIADFVENELNGDSLIVFTAFAHNARHIAADPRFAHLEPLVLAGDVKSEKVEREFQTNPRRRMLVSTAKGYQALTLTKAGIVVFAGFASWNAHRLVQACGRIERHGQKRENLLAFFLYAPHTVEAWLRTKLYQKLQEAEAIVDGRDLTDDLGIGKLSREDLINAFRGI